MEPDLAAGPSPNYNGAMSDQKIVLLHGFGSEEAIAAMRAIKAALPAAKDAAFATTTDTNLGCEVGDLIDHIAEEHRQYRESAKKK
jgi:hypothetical protein